MKAFTRLSFVAALLLAPACSDDTTPATDGSVTADGATTADAGATADANMSANDTGTSPADGAATTGDGAPSTSDGAPTTGDAGAPYAMSTGDWVILGDMPATSPLKDLKGSAAAYDVGGKTKVVLQISGAPASASFASHVHKLGCADMMAGGHYQNMPATSDAGPTDPAFGNAQNEIWLDFTTNAAGTATVEHTADFKVRAGEAKAIVVHMNPMTGAGGVSGPKLACLNIAF
jgi:Cu-Zn family superoxide dismutase